MVEIKKIFRKMITTATIIITRIRSKITKIIILRITMEIKSKKNLEKWKKKK